MKASIRISGGLLIALLTPGLSRDVLADGFRLPDQDAFATARGEAFVATADNASAIYYNPAGISQLKGWNIRAGIYGIDLPLSYQPPNSNRSFENNKTLQAAPQMFGTYGLNDYPITFGLGVFAPYGLGLHWAQDTGFRTLGVESLVTNISFNPVVAWQVLPNLSLGAGLTINYGAINLRSGLVWPTQHNDQFRFKGDDWDLGYNLGILWRPHEKVSLGVSFRSSNNFDMQGHTEYYNKVAFPPGAPVIPAFPKQHVTANAEVPFPLNVVFGISFRPTPKWNLEFDADYTDWSTLDNVTIKQARGFGSLLPKDIPAVLGWQGAWYYKLGATRYFDNGWSVSAGYIYSDNAVPDANYSPLVGDEARHWLSVGTEYKRSRYSYGIAYQFGIGPDHTVAGSAPSAIGQTADGRYEYISHALLLTIGMHF
jgi:long-chain fatty acid transport protein